MTRPYRAIVGRAARVAAAGFVLSALVVAANSATAVTESSPTVKGLTVSLVQSATAVTVDGTMGFTGVIRFPVPASSVQARLQVRRSAAHLVFQRTTYLNTAEEGTHTFSFARPLPGLGLTPGTYPVTFSLSANVGGSFVTTEVAEVLRVYDPSKAAVPVVVLAKVHARPLSAPAGGFAIDPASPQAERPRAEVDEIASLVAADPLARVSLSVPPVTLEEWRLVASSGYSLADGSSRPASSGVSAEYATTLAHLEQAIASGRLQLLTQGYSDPSLADLSANKLSSDVSVQYDSGLSAMFTSLEATPSPGTAPAGGSVPAAMQRALVARHVAYAFVDADSAKLNKKGGPPTGVYPCADSSLTALVIDARASRGLESSDASAALSRTFERVGGSVQPQPLVVRVDLDETVPDATATVGFALATFEGAPWTRLELADDAHPPKNARSVTFVPQPTRHAPAGFWARVRSARLHAIGMLAVLTTADDQATAAQSQSLLAESSAWSEPSAKWQLASSGLAFADAALKTANSVFGAVKVSAPSLTLAAATGEVPVTIQNNGKKTLNAIIVAKTSGDMKVVGSKTIPVKLPPHETYVQIPLDMQSSLYGKLTVQVLAGSVVIAKQTVTVRRSYLDRLALVGGIVIVLGGMLVWIVLRVRRAPNDDSAGTNAADSASPQGDDEPSAPPTDDALADERYTDLRPIDPADRDGA